MKTKHFFFAAILSFVFASCNNENEIEKTNVQPQVGHIDNFLERSKQTTKELQDAKIDYKRTVKLTFVIEKFKEDFPAEYERISPETNGWEIARKLKSNSHFVSLCKEEGLDIHNISYIEKNSTDEVSNE